MFEIGKRVSMLRTSWFMYRVCGLRFTVKKKSCTFRVFHRSIHSSSSCKPINHPCNCNFIRTRKFRETFFFYWTVRIAIYEKTFFCFHSENTKYVHRSDGLERIVTIIMPLISNGAIWRGLILHSRILDFYPWNSPSSWRFKSCMLLFLRNFLNRRIRCA